MNFYETKAGQIFFQAQLPALIKSLNEISAALTRPAPAILPVTPDPHFLTSLYYGDYEADIFKLDERRSPLDLAVKQAENALLPMLSGTAITAFETYQDAVQKRNSAVLEQVYASGYRTAVQMLVAGLGPQPPITTGKEAADGRE